MWRTTPLPCWAPYLLGFWWAEGLLVEIPTNVSMEINSNPFVDDSSLDKENALDTVHKEKDLTCDSVDLHPLPKIPQREKSKISDNESGNLKILHVFELPRKCHYESIFKTFGQYGKISEIRMDFNEVDEKWDAWISFDKPEDALRAACDIPNIAFQDCNIEAALSDKVPKNLDVYHPADWIEKESSKLENKVQRRPKPPQWLIATAKGENYNYFKFRKHLQIKTGTIESQDITRFGQKSVLINAKSKNQSYMLSILTAEDSDMLEDIKPHLNFSYGRGVIFNRDLYEFKEEEILEMCPMEVWKVHKIPKTTMIIFTFTDSNVPSYIYIENERISVRPYKQKPLQCYKLLQIWSSLTNM